MQSKRFDIPALADFPIHYQQQIAWGDMDAFGHVNNVQYYRYIENARLKYYNAVELNLNNDLLVILSNQCRYIRPVVYPDTLYIGVKVIKIGNTSFVTQYGFYSQKQQCIVATAEAVLVSLDENHQKMAISATLRQKIIALEAEVGNAVQ